MNALLAPWEPRADEWDPAAIQHLWRRAGFGATPAELERSLAEGLTTTLARLFEDRTDPDLAGTARAVLAAGDLELLQAWWMGMILAGGAPLRERMTLVWHDHFATSNEKVDDVRLMHAQNELFRAHALGDFRALLAGVARDPAMLLWLDGDSNRVGRPNENFARELLELFTLGIGNYAERDVRETARALSGRGTRGRAFELRPEHHDDGEKTILGSTGRLDGDGALAAILAQPACARHVARMLLEAFVAPVAREEWVAALAEVLHDAQWDVGHALRVLLASRLFHSDSARRSRIAGPVELIAVAARTLGARVAPRRAARMAADMGQALFRPPSVKGWDGGRAWIHSGSWIARHNALVALASSDGVAKGEIVVALEPLLGSAPEQVAERTLARLLPHGADPRLTESLQCAARSADDAVAARRACTAIVLTSPEFQLF
jgi:uncharacterized protein (DUF1800 family)